MCTKNVDRVMYSILLYDYITVLLTNSERKIDYFILLVEEIRLKREKLRL